MAVHPGLPILTALATVLFLPAFPGSVEAGIRRSALVEPITFSSPDEASSVAALRNRLAALSPTVRRDEAERLARCAYTTSRQLRRNYRVVWPPGLQNFLIHTGARKRGYCFQWAEDLMVPLNALKLETLELHWGEAYPATTSEHNNVVVTARGQPFEQGLLLDCWRYSGRLVWLPVTSDLHYEWKENKAVAARVLQRATSPENRDQSASTGSH
jgi:hypothetical protein